MTLDKSLPTDNYSAWIQNLESASARVRADRDEMLVKSLAGYGLTISTNDVSSGTYKTPDGVWIAISRRDGPSKLCVGPRALQGLPPSGFFDPDAFPPVTHFAEHKAMLASQIALAKWHVDFDARSTVTVDPAEARMEELAKRSKYPRPQYINIEPGDGFWWPTMAPLIALAVVMITVVIYQIAEILF